MGDPVDEAYRERAAELAELARAAVKAKRWEQAESLARRAAGLDPDAPDVRLTLGRILEERARYGEAAAEYAKAARSASNATSGLENLLRVWAAPLAIFGLLGLLVHLAVRFVLDRFDETRVVIALVALTVALLVTTAVALLRRRRRFRTLTAEDRRFVELVERDQGWSAPERRPLLLTGVVIVVLAASAVAFGAGTKRSTDMAVGDCFTVDQTESIQKVSAIPCGLPHTTEIYARFRDPAPLGAAYPGLAAIHASAFKQCLAPFRAMTGVDYNAQRRLAIHDYVPEQDYWDQGVRDTWCGVQRLDGGQLVGSVREAN
jgi:hypothetical protein